MLILKSVLFISLFTNIFANSSKLRQLIAKIHEQSDSATVYYIGNEEEFSSDFVKNEVSIPISIFNADFTEDLRQSTNIIIVFQAPDKEKHNKYLKLLQKIIESLQARRFVIISANSLDSLLQYFSFFGGNKFTRIFGILGSTLSYAYLPFAENPVQKLFENGQRHLPDALKDLNGFTIRTTVQFDPPRAFWYPHKSGQKRIGGRAGQIFLQFLRRHNATFREILINNSKRYFIDNVINDIANHELDISLNVFYRQSNLDISYPITVEEKAIMVPCNGYLDPVEYFQRPFKATVWVGIGLTVVFITMSKIILNWLTDSKLDTWGSFIEIYLTLLSSSSGKPIVSNYRFHLLVLLFGFIFERLYGSHFQSFLTAYIKIKQYDTIQDLEDNNIPVMMAEIAWDSVKHHGYPKGFDKIVVPTDNFAFARQCSAMQNTSIAYALDGDRCQYLIGSQSLLKKSLFRRAKETINSYHIGFLLPFNSPFKEILNDFIIEIRQTGLIQKWDSEVLYQVKAAGYRMEVGTDDSGYIEDSFRPLTIHHLKFAWKYLVIGFTFATMVFVLEWACHMVKTYKLV